ncbi:MAG: hypothetical protein ACXQTI_03530 [Candidatus Nezhaarchaeales archaeon]
MRKKTTDLGEYETSTKRIYVYLLAHLTEAWNPEEYARAISDTIIHELIHALEPRAGEKQIEWVIGMIHYLLGNF